MYNRTSTYNRNLRVLTPIQKQLEARFAVNEDPGKNTSSSEQGPINRFENDLFNKHDL